MTLKEIIKDALDDNNKQMSEADYENLWRRLETSVARRSVISRRDKSFVMKLLPFAAAAFVALAISVSITLINKEKNNQIDDKDVITGVSLEDEDIKLISGGKVDSYSQNVDIHVGTDGLLTVMADSTTEKATVKATKITSIIVPYGKRSRLTLADGTKIIINSGSTLEFPERFDGEKYEINMSGEIFVEVKKDVKRQFVVHTAEMDITAYGTTFNVSSYGDRREAPSVVLVEGKTGVRMTHNRNETSEIIMLPNEMVIYQNNTINKQAVDVKKHISWKDGYIFLDDTPIPEVLKKIEQYYNMSFDIKESVELQNIKCVGKLFLSANIDNVMTTISRLSSTRYRRQDNKIIIEY
ncbi:MAG: FecR domain-containing protein [Tannerella sp.]|jgi:ferric-dicitrate binding protein FerR (iron transport regulator)|nr:FecR domain-containing protein [Tannerella sp.]